MRKFLPVLLLALGVLAGSLRAAEVIPAAPTRFFNDYALTVKPETADRLNRELEDFERQTSNQLVVAIYPNLQTDSDLADYCQRVYRAWGVGQKDKNNGVVLFVFVQERKTRIATGSGLEGALPDATCEDILQDKVKPLLKTGDWDGGLAAGVEAMMQAAKGEYKGSGKTVYDQQHPAGSTGGGGGISLTMLFILFVAFLVISSFFRRRQGGTMYGGGGPIFFPIGGGGGRDYGGGDGGSFGGDSGGSSGGDSGGFSGGGGDSGGGGASGDF